MKRIHLLTLLLIALAIIPITQGSAAKMTTTAITHQLDAYQVDLASSANNRWFLGYLGIGADAILATPCVLAIDPGNGAWSNFISAAQAGVAYTVKNVQLVKKCPSVVQCGEAFPPMTITQQGTNSIRRWWPLLFERPGTTFTLNILYGTSISWDDDGPGPNPPGYAHAEKWIWTVKTDLNRLAMMLAVFHQLPFGLDEVPLISDEILYQRLQDIIATATSAYNSGDYAAAADALSDFELEVMDAAIYVSPPYPNPTGPGTGIAITWENPAVCLLLINAEYILFNGGVGQAAK